jgi:phosphopantetheinyl transferase
MPLFNKFNPRLSDLHLWEITESEEGLVSSLNLSASSNSRLNKLKSIIQRKQFLGIQNLLKLLNFETGDLLYDSYGKPKLLNGQCISISHSFDYCGIAVSEFKIGMDIEKLRPKILNISKKFVSNSELKLIKECSVINITKVWTIKEAVFKAFGYPGIDFKKNIIIETLNKEFDKVRVKVFKNEIIEHYNIEIIDFSQYICSVAKLEK